MAPLLELIRQQTTTLAQQQQLIQQQHHLLQQQRQPEQNVVSFKTFQVINPPEFQRSVDPVEAKTWLKEIEKAFALLRVREGKRQNMLVIF